MDADEPPDMATLLGQWPWIYVHFRCHWCPREAQTHIAVLASSYGHKAPLLFPFRRFVGGCPNDPHSEMWKPQKYGRKCGAYCPDMLAPRPPDLPPSLSPLTLIEGGKDDMLPADKPARRRRWRIGED